MEEKEISLNFNFLFFFPSSSCFCSLQFCFYIMCAPSFLLQTLLHMHIYTRTHTLSFTNTHTHRTRTDTFTHRQTLSTLTQGTSSTRYFTRSLLTLSLCLSFTHSLSLSRRSHPRTLCAACSTNCHFV